MEVLRRATSSARSSPPPRAMHQACCACATAAHAPAQARPPQLAFAYRSTLSGPSSLGLGTRP
uniref:Uncharacterized protein n=1 Tax=Arundo donax TaxID=35708 RepID=A0A0A8YMR0_ARUDO